jgi:hypothetical protein
MVGISSLSREFVRVPITAKESGLDVDPTVAAVDMAFTTIGVEPGAGDWKVASWETDDTRSPVRYFARCIVGPGGTVNLADGAYQVWVKVSGLNPEAPVFRAPGELVVT